MEDKTKHIYKDAEGLFKNNKPVEEYELVEKPKIKQRGLWTWGYVIYDYKKYIDNMVTLKFNTLIIWNDYLPVNIRDVISYAHENGVKIYLGFSWGWDTSCGERDAILHTDEISQNVVNTFEKEYLNLDCDGSDSDAVVKAEESEEYFFE